jgi:gliding motility-associated-like protein
MFCLILLHLYPPKSIKMRNLLLSIIFIFLQFNLYATHIVGGALTYEHLGGTSYRIKLKLYRDCGLNPITGFPFTPYAANYTVSLRTNNATVLIPNLDVVLPQIGVTTLVPLIDTCAAAPGICVQEAIYASIIDLPPNLYGYHLIFQTGDRNASIINLNDIDGTNPDDSGISLETYIPFLNGFANNSSPTWASFPPVFVCLGRDIDFNHSANDLDGDSLAYKFYHPWGNEAFPNFNVSLAPNNIIFDEVPYEPGFNVVNPINISGTPITISANGIITGIPEQLGQFVLAVMCEEYRDGVLIGRIVRDFQLNVVYCAPLKEAGIAPVNGCNSAPIQFTNTSTFGANNFHWDFGDLTQTNDTLNSATPINPSYTYPGFGNYTVSLIAQRGSVCADTTTYVVSISDVSANFITTDSICIGESVSVTDNSTTINATLTTFNWNFGSGLNASGSTLTSPVFLNSGNQTIRLITTNSFGCRDTINKPIYVQPRPVAYLGPDTLACYSNPSIQVLGLTGSATGGVWTGNGGSFSPNNIVTDPFYFPNAAEYAAGFTNLIFQTNGNGFCSGDADTLKITFISGPTADVGSDIFVCNDTLSVPVSLQSNFSGGTAWSVLTGTGTFLNPSAVTTVYLPTPSDIALGTVVLIGSNINNGNCGTVNDTLSISFFPAPTVSTLPLDTICSGSIAYTEGNSTSGQGGWTTIGDGVFDPLNEMVSFYSHGINDSINGYVDLVFFSTNNNGCKTARDTVRLFIVPAPIANFIADTVCFGDSTHFTNTSTSGLPIVSYSWTFPDFVSSNLENPATILPNEGYQDVLLNIVSSNGCKSSITKSVLVRYLPDIIFGTPSPCVSSISNFYDSTTVTDATITAWQWHFQNGISSTLQNPSINYYTAGNTFVELIATSNFGCKDSLTDTIFVFEGPTASFTTNPTSAYVDQTIVFTDQSTDNFPLIGWQWNFGNLQTSINQNPSYSYDLIGDYQIGLIVKDIHGCTDTTKNSLIIFQPPKVPGAFSPNGDSNNDILFVYGGRFKSLEFRIFNNWGELIFFSDDQSVGWDGKYKGDPQPLGVYVYTLKAISLNNIEHTLKGDFSLIR